MAGNNLVESTDESGGGGESATKPHNVTCEKLVHEMAIAVHNKKLAQLVHHMTELCPTCRTKLTALLAAGIL